MTYYELIMLVIGFAGLALKIMPAKGLPLRLTRIGISGTGVLVISLVIIAVSLVPVSLRLSGIFDQSFSVPGRVRCEGGDALGNGERRSTTIRYTAPAGSQIIDYSTVEVSRSDGTTGDIETILENGQLRTVSVRLQCESRDKMFGPGAWNNTNLIGTIRYGWLAL